MPSVTEVELVAMLGLAMIFGEREYGIARSARISELPDMACVRTVLDGIDDIEKIDENHVDESMSAVSGRMAGFHTYLYYGKNIDGQLVFRVHKNGHVTYRNSHEIINRKPPRELIRATREVMLKIEKALAAECGLRELAEGVGETCKKVDCRD